jgi:hypothetical protein
VRVRAPTDCDRPALDGGYLAGGRVLIPPRELLADRLGCTMPRRLREEEPDRPGEMIMSPDELFDQYVALWNEPDAERRRERVVELWAPDARQVLKPPAEVIEAASGLGMTATLEARGHDELEKRVTRAYDEFVAAGGYAFRRRGEAERLEQVVKFRWEMVPSDGGDVAGTGLEVLLLAPDGRIGTAYQFIEG